MISKSILFLIIFNFFSLTQNQPSNLVKQDSHPVQNNNGTSCDNPNPQCKSFIFNFLAILPTQENEGSYVTNMNNIPNPNEIKDKNIYNSQNIKPNEQRNPNFQGEQNNYENYNQNFMNMPNMNMMHPNIPMNNSFNQMKGGNPMHMMTNQNVPQQTQINISNFNRIGIKTIIF